MAVVRVSDYVEAYRLRASSPDIHRLTARRTVAGTEFVSAQILEGMALTPDDVLVDIGCGDGRLLKLAEGRVAQRIGIVPTEEEKKRLESVLPGVTFETGVAQKLTLASSSASKIICNGVLILLPTEDQVTAALQEMWRIAKPGATVWIGETPEVDEYAHHKIYRGTSMLAFLWHILKNNGARAFVGMCRRWLRATFGHEQIVLNSAGMYYAPPAKMIALAESCGLRLKSYFRHKDLDDDGNPVNSQFRYDYIFGK